MGVNVQTSSSRLIDRDCGGKGSFRSRRMATAVVVWVVSECVVGRGEGGERQATGASGSGESETIYLLEDDARSSVDLRGKLKMKKKRSSTQARSVWKSGSPLLHPPASEGSQPSHLKKSHSDQASLMPISLSGTSTLALYPACPRSLLLDRPYTPSCRITYAHIIEAQQK